MAARSLRAGMGPRSENDLLAGDAARAAVVAQPHCLAGVLLASCQRLETAFALKEFLPLQACVSEASLSLSPLSGAAFAMVGRLCSTQTSRS